MHELAGKFRDRRACVAVLGYGHDASQIVATFARAGYGAVAVDPRGERAGALREADVVVVSVPVPHQATSRPDVGEIVLAFDRLAAHARPDILVTLESTAAPGFASSTLLPRLGADRVLAGELFFAVAPWREDPTGVMPLRAIPKVVGGATAACTRLAASLYAAAYDTVVEVSTVEAAEMAAYLERAFLTVNRAVANEMSAIAERLELDPEEIVRAAATKPFGFLPFDDSLEAPSCASGPHAVVGREGRAAVSSRLLALADSVSAEMPARVVAKVAAALGAHGAPLDGARIVLSGAALDLRDGGTIDQIVAELRSRGAEVNVLQSDHSKVATVGDAVSSSVPSASVHARQLADRSTWHIELGTASSRAPLRGVG